MNNELNDNKEPEKDPQKKSFDELTKDLLEFLKDNPNQAVFQVPMEEGLSPQKDTSKPKKKRLQDIKFDLKPKEVKQYLDRFVIKQDEAKKILSIAVCDHYNHIKHVDKEKSTAGYNKQNIIMMGPTGVGKTFLIKCIAELIGVPFVKSDATKYTETGYQGGDVEDLVRNLITKANSDTQLAQYGIIYIDEIDKIATSSQKVNKDVSGRGVQSNLLKLMEDTEVDTKPAWDINAQIKNIMAPQKEEKETISTKHILFIVSGAFVGIEDITRTRLEGN